jgi:hypothetical protein
MFQPLSTGSFITKLMGYIISTGCLTRYSLFQLTSYLDLRCLQCMLNDRSNHCELPSLALPMTEVLGSRL